MRISERGQITIPKPLRERFGMHHNVEIEITPTDRGLLIRKRTTPLRSIQSIAGTQEFSEWTPTWGGR